MIKLPSICLWGASRQIELLFKWPDKEHVYKSCISPSDLVYCYYDNNQTWEKVKFTPIKPKLIKFTNIGGN